MRERKRRGGLGIEEEKEERNRRWERGRKNGERRREEYSIRYNIIIV